MCTFTYVPLNEGGCIISTNRDESTARLAALEPKGYNINHHHYFFPKDPKAGGTWIATTVEYTVCLLNGGLAKHHKKDSYKKSRGLVMLEIMEGLIKGDINPLNPLYLQGIEPFTLFIYRHVNPIFCKWIYSENEAMVLEILDVNQPHIHSSTTLYDKLIRNKREQWFQEYLKKHTVESYGDMIKFHTETDKANKDYGLQIDRKGITKTLSLTAVEVSNQKHIMLYHDFVNNKEHLINCRAAHV